jgi:para-aminobenzoate synthetase
MLDSQRHRRGEHSIMGILIPGQTIKVSYETEPRMLRYGTGLPNTSRNVVIGSIDNLWALLQQVLDVYSV